MQTHNQKRLLKPILDSAFIVVGVLLLVLAISVLSRPVEAALCRSTPSCGIWDVHEFGCDTGCTTCLNCCYYEFGQCTQFPYSFANFQRCYLGECSPP